MNGKISENIAIDCEVHAATTAASSSINYDMRSYDKALVAICLGSTGMTTCTVSLAQSSAATVAGTTSTALKAGGMVLGGSGTGITTAGGVRQLTLTYGTSTIATAQDFVVTLGGKSRTISPTSSTALNNATAWTTAQLYFMSTVSATAVTGPQLHLDNLKLALDSTLAFNGMLTMATNATNTLKLTVNDAASGPLSITGGVAAVLTMTVQNAVGVFDVNAAELDSTANKRYISAVKATADVANEMAVTVVRSGGRYMPPVVKGRVST